MTDATNEPKSSDVVESEPTVPAGVDRRTFLIRHAAIGAAAVMTGATWSPEARAAGRTGGREGCRQGFGGPEDELETVSRPRGRKVLKGTGDDRDR